MKWGIEGMFQGNMKFPCSHEKGRNIKRFGSSTILNYVSLGKLHCSTCFKYPAFNPITKGILKIRIRPLIAMECTIIADRYMGLGYDKAALDKFQNLKATCERVGGVFTLLWHNSHFMDDTDRHFYQYLLNR